MLDLNRLYVRAELDEVDIGRVKTAWRRASRSIPTRTASPPAASRASHRTCRRSRTEPDGGDRGGADVGFEGLDLKPGTSADVEVILDERDGVLRIRPSR